MEILHTVWTLSAFAVFIAVVFWAYSSKRKASFDRAAQIPLNDDSYDSDIDHQEIEH